MATAGHLDTIHVTKISVAAEIIREALQRQGREARVVALPGDYSIGPLDPPDGEARRTRVRTVLRCNYDDDAEIFEAVKPWIEATSGAVHPVYWVCLANAYEHASFLAFADRVR